MRQAFSATAATLLFLGGAAVAQTGLEITPAQEPGLYSAITQDRMKLRAPPADDFKLAVGVEVPKAVELLDVPATAQPSAAGKYKYAMFNDQVLIVDAATRKVVRIIPKH